MDESVIKLPPHNAQAEQVVLGSLMRNVRDLDFVLEIIGPDDFFTMDHRVVFAAICDLQDQADIVTVSERLEAQGVLQDIGGLPVLGRLIDETPATNNIGSYARIVANNAKARNVMRLQSSLMEATPDNWQSVADAVLRELVEIGGVGQQWDVPIKTALSRAVDEIELANSMRGLVGVTTGLSKLDKLLGGLHKSDLIVIGARPAMGKTALMLNLALNANVPLGIISAEQPADQIALRMMAIHGRINAMKMRNADLDDEGYSLVTSAMARLMNRGIQINEKPAITISQLQRQVRAWKRKHGIQALYVDYLQRVKADNDEASKTEQIGQVTRGLKEIARELQIPVVVLAQVNRGVDNKPYGQNRPGMSDLYHSSEIEMEADVVALLYRDEVYNDQTDQPGIAEIIIDKNRHGHTGFAKFVWRAECMRFENIETRQMAEGF